MPLREA
jgi:uncharacterized protein